MTRKLIAFASAAALIVGIGACKPSGGGSDVGNRTTSGQSPGSSPQGRRGDTLPRARGADAGSDMSTGTSSTPATSPSGPAGTTGTTGTTGSAGSTSDSTSGSSSGSDTKR